MSQSQFSWWYQVNEKFNDSIESNDRLLVNQEWEKLSLDWAGLYTPFDPNNRSRFNIANPEENPDDILSLLDNSEPSRNSDILNEKIELDLWETIDSKYGPLVKELYDNWLINLEIANDLIQKIKENPKERLDFNIYELENDVLAKIESICFQLDKPTKQSPDFPNDILEVPEFSEIRELKESWDLSWFNSDIYDMLSWYYVDFSSISWWEKDVAKNLEIAIKTAKWELIENHKTLNKDTERFKETVKMINKWNLKDMISWIKRLLALCYTSAWKSWERDKRFLKSRKETESTKRKIDMLNQELDTKKSELELERGESKRKKISEEISKLEEDLIYKKWELDCLGWWDEIDMISDSGDKLKENS